MGISAALAAAEVDNEADNEAEAGGEEPAEVQVEQRQVLPGKGDQPVEMQRTLHACGQRLHEIEDRGSPGEGHDGDIDGLVMVEELADEGQDDQRDRGRVDEHEHGDGILDDGAQTHIGDREGEQRKEDGPGLVGELAVRHLDKGLGSRGR